MDIADAVIDNGLPILEIGPGTAALTQHLIKRFGSRVEVCEIDRRSIAFLKKEYPDLLIHEIDFLRLNIPKHFPKGVNIVGNFPYNISSQILFNVFDNREFVPQCCGMFQKEVAERVGAEPGNKQYGQMTVVRAIDYDCEYLFEVDKLAFDPPPKVQSAVIRMMRRDSVELPSERKSFIKFVKQAFSQRRKKLRNSLKPHFTAEQLANEIFDKRPEQLSLEDFVGLMKMSQDSWFCFSI